MSLNKQLNDFVRSRGQVPIDDIYSFVESLGHKQATAERELRKSKSPNIVAILNKKGHIVAYAYRNNVTSQEMEELKEKYPALYQQVNLQLL